MSSTHQIANSAASLSGLKAALNSTITNSGNLAGLFLIFKFLLEAISSLVPTSSIPNLKIDGVNTYWS
ncbi:BZIP domain-containing protein, partial [Meloidogyne graminicola]